MQILDFIRSLLVDSGLSFAANVPDLVLAIAAIAAVIIALRIVFNVVGAVLRIGCTIVTLLIIVWILTSIF